MQHELKDNGSRVAADTRSITRIIFEKAMFGSVPVRFTLNENTTTDGWHPVHWQHHPDLAAIQFNDGSVIYVDRQHGDIPDLTEPTQGPEEQLITNLGNEIADEIDDEVERNTNEFDVDVQAFLGTRKE